MKDSRNSNSNTVRSSDSIDCGSLISSFAIFASSFADSASLRVLSIYSSRCAIWETRSALDDVSSSSSSDIDIFSI